MKKYKDFTIGAPYGNKCTWSTNDYENYSCTNGFYTGYYTGEFYTWTDKRTADKSSSYISFRVGDQVFTKYPKRTFTRREMMLYCSKFIREIRDYIDFEMSKPIGPGKQIQP